MTRSTPHQVATEFLNKLNSEPECSLDTLILKTTQDLELNQTELQVSLRLLEKQKQQMQVKCTLMTTFLTKKNKELEQE